MSKYTFALEPYEHQKIALKHLQAWRRPYFFWRMEMGTGKTKVALDNAGILYERGEIDCVVIIAPKTIVRNWAQVEIPKHLPERMCRRVLVWSAPSSRSKTWQSDFDDLLIFPGLSIFIVNVEAFSRKTGAEGVRPLLKRRKAMLILDESTTIKTPRAARTKAICRLAKLASYRRALTGSPLLPMDVYSQCQFLHPGLLGHRSFQSFKGHFGELEERAIGAGRMIKQLVGYRNMEELGQMLSRFSYHVTKDECLDLPPKVYTQRDVAMTPKQAVCYREMKDNFRAQVAEGEVTATIVLAQMVRMQQILCGWLKLDSGDTVDLPENRTAALLEVLEETEGSAIIWVPFRRCQDRLAREIEGAGLGRCAVVNGSVSAQDRAEAVEEFQSGRIRYWVGGTQVGGMGITLTRASTVVYWSNIWSLEQRKQSEDRAHRIGQENRVTYVDLLTPDSVDVRIWQALTDNLSIAEALARASRSEVVAWA